MKKITQPKRTIVYRALSIVMAFGLLFTALIGPQAIATDLYGASIALSGVASGDYFEPFWDWGGVDEGRYGSSDHMLFLPSQ